jgi:hypothetical protein
MTTVSGSSAVSGFGSRAPTPEARLLARRLARSLDRELAAGVAPPISEAHASGVKQPTAGRTRGAVAHSLDGLIERADAPASRFRITAVPCSEQVWQAEGMIRSTAARLRSAEPLDARGVARLRTLLVDTTGPCYVPSRADALTVALREISKSLDVGG